MPIRLKKPGPRNRHFIGPWRRFRGLTQEQLGERIGMSKASISRIENGETPYTQDVLETLAIVLNTTPASLLAEDPRAEDGAWQLLAKLRQFSPSEQRQALAILDALVLNRSPPDEEIEIEQRK
jgi:transcriptional regulator with XRE-family HTH domain